MKHSKPLIPLFFILLLTFPIIETVLAYNTYVVSPCTYFVYSQPYYNHVKLTNGYLVWAMARSTTTDNLMAYMIDNNGELYSSQSLDLDTGGSTGFYSSSISVWNNGTSAIIFVYGRLLTTLASKFWTLKYNSITFALTQLDMDDLAAYSIVNPQTSQVWLYNGKLYTLFISSVLGTRLAETTLAGVTTIYTVSASQLLDGAIFGFQAEDPLDDKHVFVTSGKVGANTRPTYYDLDLNAHTLTYLGEHPTASKTRNDIPDSYISLRYFGGGVEIDTSDNDYYLYHTWAYVDEYNTLNVIQHRLIFNSSGIISVNLEEQDELAYSISLYGSMQVIDTDAIYGGYVKNEGTDIYMFYCERFTGYPYAWYSAERTYHINDWFSTSTTLDYESFMQTDETVTHPSDSYPYLARSVRELDDTYQIEERYPYTSFVVFYTGLDVLEADYSLEVGYIPSGNLYTSTQYLFTATLYVNGIEKDDGNIIVRFDNVTRYSGKTNSNGELSFTVLTSISGYHELTFDVYEGVAFVESFSEPYMFFTTTEEGEAQVTTNVFLYGILSMLPIFFILVLPAMLFFAILKSGIGLIIGLVIGGILGFTTGLLPIGGFLLITLVVALFVVISVKRGD